MRPSKSSLQSQTRLLNKGTRSYREAAKRSSIVSVCLIAPLKPKARGLGDNRGGLPCRIVVTKGKPEDAAKQEDLRDPYDEWGTLEHVQVDTEAHGDRLKAALDQCLVGEQTQLGNDDRKPRRNYRDIMGSFDDDETLMLWWGTLLSAALREVKRHARRFEVFDENEKERRIQASARRGR